MEQSGVFTLYKRSVEKIQLRYDPYVGDGDNSSYREVYKAAVYGPTKLVGKEQDVGHVIKRMGTNLRSIVRDYKGIVIYSSFILCMTKMG